MAETGKPSDHAFHHVQDSDHWALFDTLFGEPVHIHLPNPFGFQITKFMIIELLAAVLILVIFIPLARRVRTGALPRGRWWNTFESLLTFVRDRIARPNIGHDADKYVPFLWTIFLFILVCNLFGMIPWFGSPTASIWVTGTLGLFSLLLMHGAGMYKMGVVHYFKALWPHLDIPNPAMRYGISGMIFFIELMGTFIKSGVLAVRLFANMFAGHLVLAFILVFILMASNSVVLWPFVTLASVVGQVALSLLELFVAFLQAYVFTFLTALFLGQSLHPAH